MHKLLTGMVLGFLFAVALFLSDMPARQTVKNRLVALDSTFLNGRLRRVYFGQPLPRLSAPLAPREKSAYAWIEGHKFLAIAHRLGPTLHGGQNTLLTLRQGMKMGFKVFEVDLALTRDGHLICYPEGSDADEDIDQLIYASYVDAMREKGMDVCHFADLVTVARQNPDVKFVLDIKNGLHQFENIYRIVRAKIGEPRLGLSFIPQLYRFEQAKDFRDAPFFGGEIFTAYWSVLTTQQILERARLLKIQVVTLPLKRFNELQGDLPRDLYILTHPVNDPFEAMRIRAHGARGIYTSYLTPIMVPELFHADNVDVKNFPRL